MSTYTIFLKRMRDLIIIFFYYTFYLLKLLGGTISYGSQRFIN